ncbi:MAG: PQQ-binding-like beta-propeller repeat protein [Paracoccaceae bacterium]|nr:PQQ-binding-like beta-propeller repeat protein [Paracoccaceae bacterium]
MSIKAYLGLGNAFKTIGQAAVKCSHHLGLAVLFVSSLMFAGCGDVDTLSGERLSVRSVLNTHAASTPIAALGPTAITLPKLSKNSDWTHGIGTPKYRVRHPALNPEFSLQWSAPIGQGDGRKHRISAEPVIADGRVFTMDSRSLLTATSVGGDTLWSYDLTPARDQLGDAGGGGLAYGNDTLYVTSGYGTLTALNPQTGAMRWVQKIDSGGASAPTVYDGIVYVVAGNGTSIALQADTGRVRWQVDGISAVTGVDGGAAPAVTDKFVIFALGTGEVFSVFRKGGLRFWSDFISGKRLGVAAATLNAVTSDPVVVGKTVYIGTHSGRLAALDTTRGKRLWTLNDGALGPVWPVGGSLFFVSDTNKLMRVRAKDGRIFWSVDLPEFTKKNPKRRVRIFGHYGPVLASRQLIVASDDGLVRVFDPESGDLLRSVVVPGGATTAPIFAQGAMYVVSTKGKLHAFR